MTYWILRCKTCGNKWKLLVSYPLKKEFKELYHYCPYCKRNTYHEIIEYIEE
ncbi:MULTISPECIES: hypothetical protein [Staphylothermus]|uniref:hypothetical protein n=1 Tax=Staphylothermus TaxID=2279 RepID=UPI001469BE2A|nr:MULTISPECIES: hypothetical protein [Staphylothermus]